MAGGCGGDVASAGAVCRGLGRSMGGCRAVRQHQRLRWSLGLCQLTDISMSPGHTGSGVMTANSSAKFRLDTLFVVHAVVAWCSGALGMLLPHLFEAFIAAHEDDAGWHPGGSDKIVHLVIRIYGVLIFAQGFIVWSVRSVNDGGLRKALVQIYAGMFGLTCLALLRAQLTGGMLAMNWVMILLFGGLSALYGWFVFVQPPTVYELPGRAMA
jgi:hypothetical protein